MYFDGYISFVSLETPSAEFSEGKTCRQTA